MNAELRPPPAALSALLACNGSFGNVVRVRHAHNIETVYAHLSSINVATGDFVTEDIELGKVGNTGRSDGMHLHYEILINDKSINPALFFKIGHQLNNTGGVHKFGSDRLISALLFSSFFLFIFIWAIFCPNYLSGIAVASKGL